MWLQKTYSFNKNDFDTDGFHIETGQWLIDLIGEFEARFHTEYHPYYANQLLTNDYTMQMIHCAMGGGKNESYGMDLVDGEINLELSLEIDKFTELLTVFGIGSKLPENEDEAILLAKDPSLLDGQLVLRYVPDEEDETPAPTLGPIKDKERIN
jgi:hypothetical protein